MTIARQSVSVPDDVARNILGDIPSTDRRDDVNWSTAHQAEVKAVISRVAGGRRASTSMTFVCRRNDGRTAVELLAIELDEDGASTSLTRKSAEGEEVVAVLSERQVAALSPYIEEAITLANASFGTEPTSHGLT